MEVVKVIGKADDFDIIFTWTGGNDWVVTVPSDLDGEYIVDVYAYDEAGNVGRAVKSLFVVDTAKLVFKLVPLKFFGEVIIGHYTSDVIKQRFELVCGTIKESYFGNILTKRLYVEVEHCE